MICCFKLLSLQCFCLAITAVVLSISSRAAEYEVEGTATQEIHTKGTNVLRIGASFTVYVRDCGWLIETLETNELGNVTRREVGSTNGNEIYECSHWLGEQGSLLQSTNSRTSTTAHGKNDSLPTEATMTFGKIPVGQLDSAVVGHLWLMFASQCYWPYQKSGRLTPVYDWHASAAAHGQGLTASAGWELLNGDGSLPRRVWFLGDYGATNALYKTLTFSQVGGTVIPTRFLFQRYRVGPLNQDTFVHEMVVDKSVEVQVTATRPLCSRTNLIPLPSGPALIIDWRFDSGVPNRPPSYRNPVNGRWPTLDESKNLAKKQLERDLYNLAAPK